MYEAQPSLALSEAQHDLVQQPLDSRIFLHGPAGSGKTTVGVARLRRLLHAGVPGSAIVVITPQRTLHEPYHALQRSTEFTSGSPVEELTIGGLARRLCELFWPIAAEMAGLAHTDRPPFFLTLESSQYYMSHIARPLLDEGYFQSVTMDRNRLYAQILDSLNKSAAVGFPFSEIGARLDAAWVGDGAQRRMYLEAQDCATRFRQFCLLHNLLDFSLQMEMLWNHLWPNAVVRDYLRAAYRHLIYDNVEEDVPRAHDIVREWLPDLESAILIYDQEAGFRRFLGADEVSGWELHSACTQIMSLHESFVMPPAVGIMAGSLAAAIREPSIGSPAGKRASKPAEAPAVMQPISARFYPELLDQIASRVAALVVRDRLAPQEIVIVGPYLSDALRFAISSRIEARGIPVRSLRPSRSLRDEPAACALLTLAALAHPHWHEPPHGFDVARAFLAALGMDLVRATLLARIVYRPGGKLTPFEDIKPDVQERLTLAFGARYSILRAWLLAYGQREPQCLDYFLRRLFGEVLSQPGFGFHRHQEYARIAGSLIESIRKFRLAMEPSLASPDGSGFDVGREYLQLLAEGVLAAQHLESWRPGQRDAVLLAPAHSFLVTNRSVAVQFWLDVASTGWFERLDQPLTHTQVLSRSWPVGKKWTFVEEESANIEGMARLITGLVHRCKGHIYPCFSQLGESGFEQRGRLLLAINQVLHADDSVES